MLYLSVPKKSAEKIRNELTLKGLFQNGYSIVKEDDKVLFPILRIPDTQFNGCEIVERDSKSRVPKQLNLKEMLKNELPEEQLTQLVTSFDIIGDIVIIEIPAELEEQEIVIGKAILESNKNVKTVLKKLGGMEGEYRIRPLKFVAGVDKTETEYKENGVLMKFDVSKVYFSVRLAHERKRISELTKNGENVLVFFAGVGPFALVIAKKDKKGSIVAIELNPDAVKSMRENIELNKVKTIIPIQGDVRKIALEKYINWADRIVMPLPKSAHEFLDVAFKSAKIDSIIHFYTIVSAKNSFEEAERIVMQEAKKIGVAFEVVEKRIVRPYSPSQVQVVLDIRKIKN